MSKTLCLRQYYRQWSYCDVIILRFSDVLAPDHLQPNVSSYSSLNRTTLDGSICLYQRQLTDLHAVTPQRERQACRHYRISTAKNASQVLEERIYKVCIQDSELKCILQWLYINKYMYVRRCTYVYIMQARMYVNLHNLYSWKSFNCLHL